MLNLILKELKDQVDVEVRVKGIQLVAVAVVAVDVFECRIVRTGYEQFVIEPQCNVEIMHSEHIHEAVINGEMRAMRF